MMMWSTASLVWASPAWAAALAAIALPVLAHLWSRRTGPPTRFTAVAMVEQAERLGARRDRWRQWVLLAMRSGIIALIVAAFTQPGWSRAAPATGADGSVGVGVIVLDASASMQRAVEGRALFDHARRRAGDLAQRIIADGGRVALIVAGHANEQVMPRPTTLLAPITAALRRVEPTSAYVDLNSAIDAAFHIAMRNETGSSTVHVLTDGQRAAWSTDSITPPGYVTLRFGDLPQPATAPQLAITSARRLGPPPIVGRPIAITAQVLNPTGADASTVVRMRCGDLTDARRITVPAGGASTVTFALQFDEPGRRVVAMSLPGDVMSLDNHAGVVLDVQQAIDVVLITGADAADDREAAFYLARAIAPSAGRYALRVLDAVSFETTRPDVLVTAAELDVPTRRIIDTWTDQGTGLVTFPSGERAATRLVDLKPVDLDHPVWQAFSAESLPTLARLRVAVVPGDGESIGGERLAESPSGEAIITTRSTATHTRVAVHAPIEPGLGNLVRSAAFCALVHQLIRQVEPRRDAAPGVAPGDSVRRVLPATAAVDAVIGPTGLNVPFTASEGVAGRIITLTAPQQPGAYTAVDAGGTTVAGFAVSFDARESNLTPGRPTVTDDGFGAATGPPTNVGSGVAPALPLWPWCVVAALLVGVIELAVAHADARSGLRSAGDRPRRERRAA